MSAKKVLSVAAVCAAVGIAVLAIAGNNTVLAMMSLCLIALATIATGSFVGSRLFTHLVD